jgi:hypothetical protein
MLDSGAVLPARGESSGGRSTVDFALSSPWLQPMGPCGPHGPIAAFNRCCAAVARGFDAEPLRDRLIARCRSGTHAPWSKEWRWATSLSSFGQM